MFVKHLIGFLVLPQVQVALYRPHDVKLVPRRHGNVLEQTHQLVLLNSGAFPSEFNPLLPFELGGPVVVMVNVNPGLVVEQGLHFQVRSVQLL